MLALIPTVVSLVLMTVAVHAIGSTPTAVMGALEPLTAVVIGVTIFGELFTARLAAGIGLILLATGSGKICPLKRRRILRRKY